MRIATVIVAIVLTAATYADGVVVKRVLDAEALTTANSLPNASLEEIADGQAVGWAPWAAGYEVDDTVSHTGDRSARCSLPVADVERGMTCEFQLNQERPLPIIATVWSRAENVSGASSSDYSLYLDLEYMDGTPLWGQTAAFECGTHDWQKRTVTVVPNRPIKTVSVHGIFRHKTGTAWFDDFSLATLERSDAVGIFDSVSVISGATPGLQDTDPLVLTTSDGLSVSLDRNTGAVIGDGGAVGGFFWRDAATDSDFRQPRARLTQDGDDLRLLAEDDLLELRLEASIAAKGDHIAISGTVEDLTGRDRAITVYFSLPLDATGWRWFNDARGGREIEPGQGYSNEVKVGAGASGVASRYPLACVATDDDACALAMPLDEPRIVGFGYDGDSRELFAGVHMGLSAETVNFPSRADFSLALYRPDPAWGFRSALKRYYDLFPACFTKRNTREGIWMPFTDVSTVDGWEDFGFQFHEGNNNVAFDDEANIDTYVYVEPVSQWLRMPEEMPRTVDEALGLLQSKADAGDGQSMATLTSAIHGASRQMYTHIVNAPWCDGALMYLNPAPSVLQDDPEAVTQWRFASKRVWRAFEQAQVQTPSWNGFGLGYDLATGEGRNGDQGIVCSADEVGAERGASQSVTLNQKQPVNLVARAWSRAEDVTGEPDSNYCVYVDLVYDDGTSKWGSNAPFEVGTHDWQQAEVVITPEKPVRSATVYALFRNDHTGRVWFDDLFLGEAGSDVNLLTNPGVEPIVAKPAVLDGIYIDSAEMAAATPNFRREHWRHAAFPLTFSQHGEVLQLTIFNSIEFARGLATQLHEHDRMLMANSTPSRFPWLAAWCDVMGTETNWGRDGEYTPQSDATLCYRRAMCYQRPYLLLLNTVYDDFPNEWVELYFKRAISYGVFPSMFSHNAANDPYWRRPNLYNRDRELFKQYIPICQAISAAGWEPVTNARCDDGAVWVERFGGADGELYLTIFNSATEATSATVTLDAAALGVAADVAARDLVTDTPVAIAGGALTVNLAAEDLAVVRLR
jgi:hypothetical protein